MTEQTQKELVKSFAYGMTAQELSTSYGISPEESGKFAEEHSAEIEEKKSQLEKDGWI